jgi:hypothetical protein
MRGEHDLASTGRLGKADSSGHGIDEEFQHDPTAAAKPEEAPQRQRRMSTSVEVESASIALALGRELE